MEATMIDLKNKTALVTGGSQGLGRGIVEVLAGEGAHVWTIARDAGRPDQLKRDVKGVQTMAADGETDVKSTFFFGKEALLMPMAPGSVVVIMSSGAAIMGSSLSGGYAGSKRMHWFLAQYLQEEANRLNLGIRFVALVPRQIIGATELGHIAASAYAARQGITEQAYLERFGVPLTPEKVGHGVVALLTDSAYQDGTAFGMTGQGMEALK